MRNIKKPKSCDVKAQRLGAISSCWFSRICLLSLPSRVNEGKFALRFALRRNFPIRLGVPKLGCFKPGCLQFLRGSAPLHSFTPFCALLRSFAYLHLHSFELICALLRSFVCFCVRAFRMTAFGNFAMHVCPRCPWEPDGIAVKLALAKPLR